MSKHDIICFPPSVSQLEENACIMDVVSDNEEACRMKRRKYWYRIDNAGKIFPAISKKERSNVFRISFYLDETIDVERLNTAINQLLPRFEALAVQMKNGLFWSYFAATDRPFHVEKEPSVLCKFFRSDYLFKVYYLDNKITLETFHALTDGTGALAFFKSIIYHYYRLKGYAIDHEYRILSEFPYSKRENEDMFVTNYDKARRKNLREVNAYRLEGERFDDHWVLFIKVRLDTKSLIDHVKKTYNVTLTQYVTAVIAYSIIQESIDFQGKGKPLKMFIPVNLRPYFDSVTLRNFSLFIKTVYDSDKKRWTFDDVLEQTKDDFVRELDKDRLIERMSSNVDFEKKMAIRILPLFLKTIAFRIGYNILGEKITTTSFSNLGIIDLPSGLKEHVLDLDFANAGYGFATTMLSVGDHTNIMFTSSLKDTSIFSHFVSFLVKEGLNPVIDTNYEEGYDEIL